MNLQKMMKQAQEMQQKMESAKADLENKEVKGSAGAGMVEVTLNGKGVANTISIDKNLLNDAEGEVLEDLLVAAFNDAKKKVDDEASKLMSDAMGGMSLPPDMKLPF